MKPYFGSLLSVTLSCRPLIADFHSRFSSFRIDRDRPIQKYDSKVSRNIKILRVVLPKKSLIWLCQVCLKFLKEYLNSLHFLLFQLSINHFFSPPSLSKSILASKPGVLIFVYLGAPKSAQGLSRSKQQISTLFFRANPLS